MPSSPINVHISYAEAAMHAGLHALLSGRSEVVVAAGHVGLEALTDAQVLVTDYASGLVLARKPTPRPAILVVSYLDKEWEIRTALASGVQGYLPQSVTADELVHAVQQLARGVVYLGDSIARSVADGQNRASLTERESDVLQLLAEGYCNKLIARRLGIGLGTVKSHVKGLMGKLEATARTHAVVVAAARGLVTPGGHRGDRVAAPAPLHSM